MNSRRFVCRESSILSGDGGSVMTVSPSRPEARRRFGSETANELGAPVASSIPEQLPGREPASTRLGASPHQQGRDTKMEMLSFGGIDVSKDRLDITVLPDEQCSSVSNDAAGWAELIEQLRGSLITAIGVEASGGYERGVVRALLAAGMSVRQINPYKLRQFAKASGTLAKNDRLDARMIASFVAVMPTRPAQRQAPMIEQLAAMLTVRRQLSEQKVATENASRLLEG